MSEIRRGQSPLGSGPSDRAFTHLRLTIVLATAAPISFNEPMEQTREEQQSDPKRQMLRHTVATLAYRGAKALRDAPGGFAQFQLAETTRTPGEILAHVGDLLDWALALAQGRQDWKDSPPVEWEAEVRRFFGALDALDLYLISSSALHCTPEQLFQGPVADALTHIGQIAMLRRLAKSPIRGENYFRAQIQAGRVGPNQAEPVREFD
jgi:hypothetical protein